MLGELCSSGTNTGYWPLAAPLHLPSPHPGSAALFHHFHNFQLLSLNPSEVHTVSSLQITPISSGVSKTAHTQLWRWCQRKNQSQRLENQNKGQHVAYILAGIQTDQLQRQRKVTSETRKRLKWTLFNHTKQDRMQSFEGILFFKAMNNTKTNKSLVCCQLGSCRRMCAQDRRFKIKGVM